MKSELQGQNFKQDPTSTSQTNISASTFGPNFSFKVSIKLQLQWLNGI